MQNPIFRTPLALALALAFAAPAFAEDTPTIEDLGDVAVVQKDTGLSADWAKGPFIEIYVRGFKDSNGDGHGDLKGVIEKLDYIKSLGYTGIWLMPIYLSEDGNHGYAVTNYRKVEVRYGKQEDLQKLTEEAHKRGIGIILDYVINHSAYRHPLFTASADKGNRYRDWFVWANGDKPEGWSGLNGESWYARGNDQWYYAVFWERMPDFNLKNPDVINFHKNNLRYWLNQGVDGFRFDAVAYLVENGAIGWENQPENYKLMHDIQGLLKEYQSPKFMVCEATTDAPGFAQETGCGSAFAFGLQKAIIKSVQFGRADRDLVAYIEKNPINRMATFLNNHDSFAGMRIYSQLNGDQKAYKLAAATQFLIPGIPFTYYGEEIGMGLAQQDGKDEQIRAPMPWNGTERIQDEAGKTTAVTWGGFTNLPYEKRKRLFRSMPENWQTFNVEAQEKDPNSLLNFYRQVIALRKGSDALTSGNFKALSPMRMAEVEKIVTQQKKKGTKWVKIEKTVKSMQLEEDPNVFVFLRETDKEKVLVAINYAEQEHRFDVKLGAGAAASLAPLWPQGETAALPDAEGNLKLTVPGSSFKVFKLN